MKPLSIFLTGVSLALTGTPALAASSEGTVVRFDTSPHTMTLSTGEVILVPAGVSVDRISAGDFVHVNWQLVGSNRTASSVSEPFEDHGT